MKVNKEDDRRRFFRITDAIGVAYEVIDEAETKASPNDPEVKTELNIQALLNQHSEEINSIILALGNEQPLVAKAVAALNKKIDTLLQFSELDSLASHQHFQSVEEASISACGIAFPINESLDVGKKLNLTLYLKPSEENIHAVGQVIDCKHLIDNDHYLRVEFTDMSDSYRESLIQHIVQRQGALLKSLREQLDDSE